MNSRIIIGGDLLIGLNAYLQEFAVFVFNGKSETIVMVLVLCILVGGELMKEFPGGGMQCKHSQEYDSQYFMYPVPFHSTVS